MNKKNIIIISIVFIVIVSVIAFMSLNKENSNSEVIDDNTDTSSKEDIDNFFNNDKTNKDDKEIVDGDGKPLNENQNPIIKEDEDTGGNINSDSKADTNKNDDSSNKETNDKNQSGNIDLGKNTDSQKEDNEKPINNNDKVQNGLDEKKFEFNELEKNYEENNKLFPLNDLNSLFNDKVVVSNDFTYNDKKVKSERIPALEEKLGIIDNIAFKSVIINKKDGKGKEKTIKAISNKNDKEKLVDLFKNAEQLDGFSYDEYPDYVFNLINGEEGTVVKMQFWIERNFNKNKVLITTVKNSTNNVPINNAFQLTNENLKEFNKIIGR